jgi:hypothetical protein
MDADALAQASGEFLFIARCPTASLESGKYRPAERAQLWVQAAPDKKKPSENVPTRYIEFEFTSPRKDLAKDQIPELQITWEIHRKESPLGDAKWSDDEVVFAADRSGSEEGTTGGSEGQEEGEERSEERHRRATGAVTFERFLSE